MTEGDSTTERRRPPEPGADLDARWPSMPNCSVRAASTSVNGLPEGRESASSPRLGSRGPQAASALTSEGSEDDDNMPMMAAYKIQKKKAKKKEAKKQRRRRRKGATPRLVHEAAKEGGGFSYAVGRGEVAAAFDLHQEEAVRRLLG